MVARWVDKLYARAQVMDRWEEPVVSENERRRREAAKAHLQQQEAKAEQIQRWVGDRLTSDGLDGPATRNSGTFYMGPASIQTRNSWGTDYNTISVDPGRAWQTKDTSGTNLTMEEFRKALTTVRQHTGMTMEEAAKRLSALTGMFKDNGHKLRCAYVDGSKEHACSCQPPTLWGNTLFWFCECCEKPEAQMRFGLCDMCRAHEYAPVEQVRVDHEVEDA